MATIPPHGLAHGLSADDVAYAWDNYAVGAVRVPGELEVRIGFDPLGREIEMVGSLLAGGDWLVYHAMTPPTKKVRGEIEKAMRRN